MKKSLNWIACASVVLVLGGCQTIGGPNGIASQQNDTGGAQSARSDAPAERSYSFFYDQGDHLKELIKAGQYEAAAALYEKYQTEFFEPKKDKYAAELDGLGAALDARYRPRFDADLNALPKQVSADPATWPAAKTALAKASADLTAFAPCEALVRGPRRSPSHDALAERLKQDEVAWRAAAPDAFSAYDSGQNFFAAYPVEFEDHATFLAGAFPHVEGKLQAAGKAAVLGFVQAYKDDLAATPAATSTTGATNVNEGPVPLLGKISNLFVGLALNEAPIGADRLKAALQAVDEARKQGLVPTEVPGMTIAFVETTSKTLLKEGQIEFPVAIDVDLPFKTVKTDLDKALSEGGQADYVVALEVSMAKTLQRIQRIDRVSSRYLAGHRDVPNPAYEPARMAVYQAQSAVSSNEAQFCQGYGCLGKAIAGIALAVRLKSANEAFSKTPMTLSEPVYQGYQFNASDMDDRKTVTANYYVISPQQRNYFKSVFDVGEDKHFRVAYNLNDNDPSRDTYLKQYDNEESVKHFDEAPVTVRLSDVLAQFVAKGGESRPFRSLTALRDEMLQDKNTALTAYRERAQDQAASTQNDARFDSVVEVLNPKGELGAGFFVQPDLILTNYHVIDGTQFVEMKMHNGLETFGKVVKSDARLDLALIRCQARGTPVAFHSGAIPLGATVEAIGHPNGLEFSITRGVVSAIRERPSPMGVGGKPVLFVQTDTPINPGNSGGPLFLNNEVIAVNDNKFVSKRIEGIGFAIHYTEIETFLKEGF